MDRESKSNQSEGTETSTFAQINGGRSEQRASNGETPDSD